jgi:hypothetical protein
MTVKTEEMEATGRNRIAILFFCTRRSGGGGVK